MRVILIFWVFILRFILGKGGWWYLENTKKNLKSIKNLKPILKPINFSA